MPLIAETESTIFGQILKQVVNSTNVTRSSPGSKTRALVEAVSKKMGSMYRKFDRNIALAFLAGAEGQYLNFIGDMMGVPRLGQEAAKVLSNDQVVRVYVDIGTFGDINNGQAINLSAGTFISSRTGGTGVVYQVPHSVILSASLSETFIPVQALKPGASSNIGKGQLIFHNFTGYADSLNDTLKVTNDADITNGKDTESEVNYKFRIANQVVASEKANSTAVRLAALGVPGVADITEIPYARGVGSLDILIKATVPTVTDSLIESVQAALFDTIAQGVTVKARKPIETGMSITGTLTLRRRLSPSEESNITRVVTDNVTNYINSLDIGEDWIENETIERVMATSDEIKNVGVAGKPFDQKYIYKFSRLEDNKIRKTLLGDYSPRANERVIVENQFAGANPIQFTIAT